MISKSTLGLRAVFLVLTAFAISGNTVPPLVTTIAEEFDSGVTVFGYVFSLQYLAFAAAAWTGGWLGGRFGLSIRSLVIAGLFAMGVLLLGGAILWSSLLFAIWAVPLGYAGGLTETFSAVMITRLAGSRSSKMMNLSQVFFCLGAIFAPQLVAVFLRWQLPKHAVFICLGLIILVIGVIFVIFTEPTVKPAGNITGPARSGGGNPTDPPRREIPLLSDTSFYLLAGALLFYVAVECSFVCWIATFFEKHLGVSKVAAASRLRDFWIGLIVGRTCTLFLPQRWTLWPAAGCGVIGLLIACALLSFPWPATVATGLVFLAGVGAGPFWPVTIVLSQHLRNSARFTAAVIGVGAIGAALGPLISGWVIGEFGFGAMFLVMTAECAVVISAFLLARAFGTNLPVPAP